MAQKRAPSRKYYQLREGILTHPGRTTHNIRRNDMGKLKVLRELWEFLRVRKRWWLMPIVIILILLGFLIIFSESSAVAPFIYTLF